MLHFVEAKTRKISNTISNVIIDGYTTRKTIVAAAHEISKAIEKYSKEDAEMFANVKTASQAKELLCKNYMNNEYCFELEAVSCATKYNEETDEVEYEDGTFYFLVRLVIYDTQEATPEETTEATTTTAIESKVAQAIDYVSRNSNADDPINDASNIFADNYEEYMQIFVALEKHFNGRVYEL